MAAPQNLRAAGDRIEHLLEEQRRTVDGRTFAQTEELLRLVSELYGAGLARIVEIARQEAPSVLTALAADELVAGLLVVHELHPLSLTERVNAALEQVRPLLARHAGDVELVDVDPDAAAIRIRLLGSCDGCPSSAVTLQSAVERAVLESAPEIVTIDVDAPPAAGVGVPVELRPKPAYEECPSEMVMP